MRVHELAKECGVDSSKVLSILKQHGEFVKSASSTIEAAAAVRVRRALEGADPGPASNRNPFNGERQRPTSPPPRPIQRKRREWYRGEPVSDFVRRILDEHIVAHAHPDFRPKGAAYFDDEVKQARDIADEWAPTLLEGLTMDNVLLWLESGVGIRAKDAPALQRAGVRPREIGWSHEDGQDVTLGERLFFDRWTVEQVINEVEARRQGS